MRLVAFENGREIWACRQCDHRSRLLDCHFCERRGVAYQGQNAQKVPVWACGFCGHKKHQCPECFKGWVMPKSLLQPGAEGAICDSCNHEWQGIEQLGELNHATPRVSQA
jgi:hypothetical protein